MSRFKDSLGKAKILLSQLLCIGAVFTACTDEEVVNQADTAPLQVSVNTSLAKQSRAIVHGEWLPSGSTIGVSLFDTEGDDYDGQGYYNIQYKATGAEEDQVWSSMGVTPAVSANEAVLVAYHPYNNDEDLDITAIPVEIASQTDYMYSGPVTGITNAAPKADIVLDHALTAIRVKLVLGDFTGDAAVSEIAVTSPALASSGTLNAADGSLNNIAGQGDKFTLPVDFGLIASGTDNDVMFVPDASVESGVTTVSANIGGKKYTAGIEFDEAYKQGYIYTYTLTLNNSGFAVTKVNVNPWETGTDDSAVLQPVNDNAYTIKIVASYTEQVGPASLDVDDGVAAFSRNAGDAFIFNHNVMGFVGTIDWGDGTTDTYTEPVDNPTHQYPNDGTVYTITAKGTIQGFKSENYTPFSQCLKEIVYIGSDCNIVSFDMAFSNCQGLTSIPAKLFDNCTEVTSFKNTFQYCYSLQAIPVGLFDKCTEIKDFSSTFWGTGITAIPEGLFDKCTEVTNFYGTFGACDNLTTIPEGLFDKCTGVTSFGETFQGCTALTEIPVGLFDKCTEVTSFEATFRWCPELKTIPKGLFDKCTKVDDFSYAFSGCEKLQTIPDGLFEYNINAVSFMWAFSGCTSLTAIPEGLFDKCIEATRFESTFRECWCLQIIPTGLFDNNRKVLYFNETFEGCTALTGESPYTIINVDGQDVKVHLYERNNYGNYFQRLYGYENCFEGCTNLTDYNSIPKNWKNYTNY